MRNYIYSFIIVFFHLQLTVCSQEVDNLDSFTFNEHQFQIEGDFNGNGEQDTVRIVYFFPDMESQFVKITFQDDEELRKKYCILQPQIKLSAGSNFKSSTISNNCKASGPQEITYLGDINGDGRDEFALLLWEFNRPAEYLHVYSYQDDNWTALFEFEYYVQGNPKYYPSIDDYFERNDDFKALWFIDKDGKKISLNQKK